MCYIFGIVEEIALANYADCNTPFVSGDTSDVLESLENELSKRFGLFSSKQMKASPHTYECCYFLNHKDKEI